MAEKENIVPAEIEPKFVFESEDEKELGIETKTYPNGAQVKRYVLRDGREALIRELTGEEMQRANRLVGKETEKALGAIMSLCIKLDGAEQPMELYGELKGRDFSRLRYAASALNF